MLFQTERKRWFGSTRVWGGDLPIQELIELRRSAISASFAQAFAGDPIKQLPEPHSMMGLEKAAHRISQALLAAERVTIFGDYDVDGTVSCALLSRFLDEYGFKPEIYIPNRLTEGYGLNPLSVQKVFEAGTKVIVTVDNGIAAHEACALARALGIDVVVTDHHEPPANLPEAFAIVNPKQPGCTFPYKDLAGVGVAFYLAIALRQALAQKMPNIKPNLRSYLDFVAIGTIADMCPLTGLNHLLTRLGLQSLATNLKLGNRPGIQCLAEVAGIEPAIEISAEQIAFQIGPRLNAAGRLGTALKAAELLSTPNLQQAEALAKELDLENKERRAIEKLTFAQAQDLIEATARADRNTTPNCKNQEGSATARHSLVLFKREWHPGVLGIVASRCVEKFYKPSLILTEVNGVVKGSGRSTEEINLFQILDKYRENFLSFGGHSKAIGLSMNPDQVAWLGEILEEEVKQQLDSFAHANPTADRESHHGDLRPPLVIDAVVDADRISPSLNAELSSLEPFGFGNSRPKFAVRNVVVTDCKAIGQNHSDGHCRVEFSAASHEESSPSKPRSRRAATTLQLTAFSLRAPLEKALLQGTLLNIAIEVSESYWKGRKKLELRLCDFGAAVQG